VVYCILNVINDDDDDDDDDFDKSNVLLHRHTDWLAYCYYVLLFYFFLLFSMFLQ